MLSVHFSHSKIKMDLSMKEKSNKFKTDYRNNTQVKWSGVETKLFQSNTWRNCIIRISWFVAYGSYIILHRE